MFRCWCSIIPDVAGKNKVNASDAFPHTAHNGTKHFMLSTTECVFPKFTQFVRVGISEPYNVAVEPHGHTSANECRVGMGQILTPTNDIAPLNLMFP